MVALIDDDRIEELRTLPANWNGYDAAAPNQASIDHTIRWSTEQNERIADLPEPTFVNLDAWGDVVFEWRADRGGMYSLTIYIESEVVSYLKAWGPDINTEMEDGDIERPEQVSELFDWLKGMKHE